jgi:hypothetical protein
MKVPADRWRSTGHAQMASTAIIAAPRQMATIFIFTRGNDMGFTPHRASETVNSGGSLTSSNSWLIISTPMCVSVPADAETNESKRLVAVRDRDRAL